MNKILRLFTVLSCIVLLLTYLAGHIDPRSFWPLAFISLAYVPVLLITFLFLFILTLQRSWFALVPLCCILLGWSNLTNSFSLHKRALMEPKSALADSSAIRVMTYNVHFFNEATQDPENSLGVFSIINRIQPDVACFQEFYSDTRPNKLNSVDSLKRILHTTNFHYVDFSKQGSGMAIFAKYPIVAKGIIPFSEDHDGNQCIYVDLLKNGHTFRIYAVHLESIRLQQYQLNYMSKFIKGKTQKLRPSKKIGGQLRRAFLERAHQVDLVRAHAATSPYPYLICGDFNDPPSSYAFNQMAKGMQSTYKEKGSGLYAVTLHKGFLRYQIDHILTSPGWSVLSHIIVAEKASDHYPVYTDLSLSTSSK
ncbi:hypothetical protein ADIARSV_3971 [Arcticibacter svalbardensis MN12-7]|uniref:Endonuclease/exonuclease/phosphatase domain-containing protein n=1 Tax=Arcticibacter svalbardensis MN12-7 TaxID=1150600 RepID=R9GMC1_9SPHI|nr:endonuclease/exonuclease/phosphatase family protein [Arcticibacter svalbardensis]EOR92883.1 hypothetical protein ADIARSV_3971 [Arcticibacter svalbardensis MN12-7]